MMMGTDAWEVALAYTLMVAGAVLLLVCGSAFIYRRRVFPLNGRVVPFVLVLEIILALASLDRTLQILGVVQSNCIYRLLVDQWQDLLLANIVFVRLFRLWFKAMFSREQLRIHRRQQSKAKLELDEVGALVVHELSHSTPSRANRSNVDALDSGGSGVGGEGLRRFSITTEWFVRRAHLGKTPFLWKMFGVMNVFVIAVQFALFFSVTNPFDGCQGADRSQPWVTYTRVPMVFAYTFLGWQVRNVRDGFFIKEEMKLSAILALAVLVLIIAELVAPRFVDEGHLVHTILHALNWVCANAGILLTAALPVYWSYRVKWEKVSRELPKKSRRKNTQLIGGSARGSSSSDAACSDIFTVEKSTSVVPPALRKLPPRSLRAHFETSLKEILTNNNFLAERRDFENHIACEFAIENLVFWDTVSDFKRFVESSELRKQSESKAAELLAAGTAASHMKSPDSPSEDVAPGVTPGRVVTDLEVATRALRIYAKFVAIGSPLELNIKAQTRREIESHFNEHVSNFGALKCLSLKQVDRLARAIMAEASLTNGSTMSNTRSSMRSSDGGVANLPKNIEVTGRMTSDTFERSRDRIYRLMAQDTFKRWRAIRRQALQPAPSVVEIATVE